MPLPNFIIFGTRKAGTTSLYHYLHQHPEIYMTPLKGTRYFLYDKKLKDADQNVHARTLNEYSELFSGAVKKNATAIGEASPSYMYSGKACIEISKTIPEVKLIASLRNPIDMTFSYYQMQMRNLRPSEFVPLTIDNVSRWADLGLYGSYLKKYYTTFNSSQIKILIFEEWIKDPTNITKNIFKFLSVDENFIPDMDMQYNPGGVAKNSFVGFLIRNKRILNKIKPMFPVTVKTVFNKFINSNMEKLPPMNQELRDYLREYFKKDTLALQEMLGRDLMIWLEDKR